MMPWYRGSAMWPISSSAIHASPSRDRTTPGGRLARGTSSTSYSGCAQRERHSVRATSPGFSRCPCRNRASASRRSGPAVVSNSQSSSLVADGSGRDGSTPIFSHSSSMGRQSPHSQRLYSSGR